jgi:hypothetical protein
VDVNRVAAYCEGCGASLEGRRKDCRFCSDACRVEAWRTRNLPGTGFVTVSTAPVGSQTPSSSSTPPARRPSRDGRGVRAYVLPEDSREAIIAKVEAARARKAES